MLVALAQRVLPALPANKATTKRTRESASPVACVFPRLLLQSIVMDFGILEVSIWIYAITFPFSGEL